MNQGQHVISDDLSAPHQYRWDSKSNSGSTCAYENGAYHAGESQPAFFNQCLLQHYTFTDFLFQATVQITQGDEGGLIFRANASSNVEFHFDITTDGHFDLIRQTLSGPTQLILPEKTNAIHTGYGQINHLAVLTEGGAVHLYVNQLEVALWVIGTSSGAIGFLAYDLTNATSVAYFDADVWNAPAGY
jgi:hypothetical protein